MRPVLLLLSVAACAAPPELPQVGGESDLAGTWEYLQANSASPTGFDAEGERLVIRREERALVVEYFGLEREGDHGLFYTAVPVTDLTLSPEGQVAFTVGLRDFFRARPASVESVRDLGPESEAWAGVTSQPLQYSGLLQADTLTLRCTPRMSCPDTLMRFTRISPTP